MGNSRTPWRVDRSWSALRPRPSPPRNPRPSPRRGPHRSRRRSLSRPRTDCQTQAHGSSKRGADPQGPTRAKRNATTAGDGSAPSQSVATTPTPTPEPPRPTTSPQPPSAAGWIGGGNQPPPGSSLQVASLDEGTSVLALDSIRLSGGMGAYAWMVPGSRWLCPGSSCS